MKIAAVKGSTPEIYSAKVTACKVDPLYDAVAHVRHGSAGSFTTHFLKLCLESFRRLKTPLIFFGYRPVSFVFFNKISFAGSEIHLCSLSLSCIFR